MKNVFDSKKGITLIALIITIIVLLILAGISMSFLMGDNGILSKAKSASDSTNEAQARESINLVFQEARLEMMQNTSFNTQESLNELLESKIDSIIINADVITVNGYNFKIDRTKLAIVESLGQSDQIKIINNSGLIGEISKINETGFKNLDIIGKNSSGTEETVSYAVHIIVHEGDLVLDGTSNIEGATLNSNVYEFGDNTIDVGTSASNATNMVVLKVNGNLTINSGVKATSCSSNTGYGGPKGMMIYCSGDVINNGEISMTAKGAKAVGQNVYLWKNSNDTYEYIASAGAAGSARCNCSNKWYYWTKWNRKANRWWRIWSFNAYSYKRRFWSSWYILFWRIWRRPEHHLLLIHQ